MSDKAIDVARESWRPIPGYEGLYEVSDFGRARSVDRWYVRTDNRRYFFKGKILRQSITSNGYLTVTLRKNGTTRRKTMHRLVLLTFEGQCPAGMETCHNNGKRTDNRLSNLRWDTGSNNKVDTILHGNNPQSKKTHCPRGHLLKDPNLRRRKKREHRECLSCDKARNTIRNRGLDKGLLKEIADSNYSKIMAAREAMEQEHD